MTSSIDHAFRRINAVCEDPSYGSWGLRFLRTKI
jgi:hypothetical protein